ncbi:hypothetical protein LSH36_419g03029 [Paralvinella palmiformis]|uniref:Uncharacterized protein n=1 Tax=Paralvinella palmiformis TaxID=53620 RepID=A0AAD9JCR2_9ANNE|nr:hypothetical protein LSH36_419g03029 [Paralvinella palmiformis]
MSSLIQAGKYKGVDINTPYKPEGSIEEEIDVQQQQAYLESSIFDVISELANKIGTNHTTGNDPNSAAEQQQVIQAITKEVFDEAILDIPITETEEGSNLAKLEKRERAIATVQSKAVESVLEAASTITRVLASTTVTSSTIATDTFSITVTNMDAVKREHTNQSIGVGSVVIVDKSVFGIGEDAEINAPVVLFKMDILRGGVATPLYGYHFLLQQEIKRNVPRNCSDISIVDDDTGMVYISTELRNHSTYSIELETETATDAKIMVRVIAT